MRRARIWQTRQHVLSVPILRCHADASALTQEQPGIEELVLILRKHWPGHPGLDKSPS